MAPHSSRCQSPCTSVSARHVSYAEKELEPCMQKPSTMLFVDAAQPACQHVRPVTASPRHDAYTSNGIDLSRCRPLRRSHPCRRSAHPAWRVLQVMRLALQDAGMQAHELQALELHGTGTALGDPIELGAAASVLGGQAQAATGRPLSLSAAKSYLGHTEPAAGATSMYRAMQRCAFCPLPRCIC